MQTEPTLDHFCMFFFGRGIVWGETYQVPGDSQMKTVEEKKLGKIHGRVLNIDERVEMTASDLASSKKKKSVSLCSEPVREKRTDGRRQREREGKGLGGIL